MDGAAAALALVVDEQGTLPGARHYAQPTLHVQEGLVCWATFPGEMGDSGFKPRLDAQPTPPGRGREGLGGVLWPSCLARGGGRQNPDSSPRKPGSGGLGAAVSTPRPVLTLDSCVALGTGPLSLGLFPISHPDWVPCAPGPDTV